MAERLWVLPTKPGTVIDVGLWRFVKLEPYEGTNAGGWELLPARDAATKKTMSNCSVKDQCVYGDEWVLAEAEQEGGYFVIAEPVEPYGPTMQKRSTCA